MEEQNRVPEVKIMNPDGSVESVPVKGPTHIVLTYPSQDTEIMFRASDMMMIAERQKCTIVFGEDPSAPVTSPKKKQSRVFMESDIKLVIGLDEFPWNHNGSRYMREVIATNDLMGRELSTPLIGPMGQLPDSNPIIHPVIEDRCQEGLILMAPDSLDMRTNGGGMEAVNMKPFNKSLKTN